VPLCAKLAKTEDGLLQAVRGSLYCLALAPSRAFSVENDWEIL